MKKIIYSWKNLGVGDVLIIGESKYDLPPSAVEYNRYLQAHVRVRDRYRTVFLYFHEQKLLNFEIAFKVNIDERVEIAIVKKAVEAAWNEIEKANVGDWIKAPKDFEHAVTALEMFAE